MMPGNRFDRFVHLARAGSLGAAAGACVAGVVAAAALGSLLTRAQVAAAGLLLAGAGVLGAAVAAGACAILMRPQRGPGRAAAACGAVAGLCAGPALAGLVSPAWAAAACIVATAAASAWIASRAARASAARARRTAALWLVFPLLGAIAPLLGDRLGPPDPAGQAADSAGPPAGRSLVSAAADPAPGSPALRDPTPGAPAALATEAGPRSGGGGTPTREPGWPQDLPRPRHVVLISIDTLRADHLSCYGYARATSPNIDRLASQGVRFSHPWAQYTMTSPSVASLFTGTYPTRHGLVGCRTRLPDEARTLAESMAAGGFLTSGFVTNPNLARSFGFAQGFEEYTEIFLLDTPRRNGLQVNGHILPWIERQGERPFFVYLHYVDPHSRYEPGPPFRDRFAGDALDGRLDHLVLRAHRKGSGEIPTNALIEGSTDPDLYVARYDEEILAVDAAVGQVLEALDRARLAEDTLVILTADHGESLVEHGVYFNHGRHAYEDNARVPLIVRYPAGLDPGRVVGEPVESVDVLPTILDMVGVPVPDTVEGRTLAPLLRGLPGQARPWVRVEAGHTAGIPSCALRAGPWKVVYNERGIELTRHVLRWRTTLSANQWRRLRDTASGRRPFQLRWELYDLEDDPGELRNLAAQRTDVLARLAPEIARWRASMPSDRALGVEDDATDPRILEELKALGYVH